MCVYVYYKFMCNLINILMNSSSCNIAGGVPQIEQEMGGEMDVKSRFFSNWKKYYPGIIHYGESSGEKVMTAVLSKVDEDGEFINAHLWYIHE